MTALRTLLAFVCGCGLPSGDYFGKVPVPDPSTIRFCNAGEPEYVDPAMVTSTTGTVPMRFMFAGLADFGTDIEGTSVPSLAESWTVSPDQRTYSFKLRTDARWSNGRPITSADFVYHVMRILHPSSISRNVDKLKLLKNAALYSRGRVKVVTENVGEFRAGDIVELIGEEQPDSNVRQSSQALALRDLGAPAEDAYALVPPRTDVELIELGGPDRSWAYVFWRSGSWFYGWVPLASLDISPAADVRYSVREIAVEHRVGVTWRPDRTLSRRTGTVFGRHLLSGPEVLGVFAPDPHTLVLETWGPTPYLINELAERQFRPTPRESVSRSPQKWTKPKNNLLVTSGPYQMIQWRERDKMVFEKSETFFAREEVRTKRWVFYNMSDQAASSNLYFQGSCDAVAANNIPYSYLPAVSGKTRGRPYKDFVHAPYLGIYYYAINTDKVTSVHLRRALNFAIDRRPIPGLIGGGEHPTASFVPGRAVATLSAEELERCSLSPSDPGVVLFVTPDHCYHSAIGLDFDPDKARSELELAKRAGDFDSSIEIKFNSGADSHKIIAEYIQDQWKRHLGLTVELKVQEWKTFLKDTAQGNYEVGRLGWIGSSPDPESQFLNLFACTGGKPSRSNRTRWCSDDYDRLFAQAGSELDRGKRLELLHQAESLMIEAAPIIPLYVYTQKHLRKPYLRDFPLQLGDNTAMWRAWIDPNWNR